MKPSKQSMDHEQGKAKSKTAFIRQGGVLSVLQYTLRMDEINKEIQGTDLGIKIRNTETNIAWLLWMDDVLLLATRPEEKQELLDITNKVADK